MLERVDCDGRARRLGHPVLAAGSTLRSAAVADVLVRLAALEGDAARRRERKDVGELLYVLAFGRRARRVVEFGAAAGVSTIHLAAALRDGGGGSILTTEPSPEQARRARANLAVAGLDDLVDLRAGDGLETLRDLAGPVDLLLLAGANDLYLPVLELLDPHLAPGGLVVADMSRDDPHHDRYRHHVGDPAHGYSSLEVPLDAGVVLSARRG